MLNCKSTLVFITEARFYKDKNNNIYCDPSFDQKLWSRYLSFFKRVVVFSRIENILNFEGNSNCLCINEKVSFVALPYYIGLKNLLLKNRLLKKTLHCELLKYNNCSIIIRVPGAIGFASANILRKHNIGYATEVVGDPYEVFGKGNFTHPLRLILQVVSVYQLKYVVKYTSAALYVTQLALQTKYPVQINTPQFAVSDVLLPDVYIAPQPKKWKSKPVYSILCVGSLAQMYKGPDVVLKAIQLFNLKNSQCQLELTWLGDGVFKQPMELLAKDLMVDNKVKFLGNVSSVEVFKAMNLADIYVLASRTEGLPRVIVEAMASGLPIIATSVGGVPELLDDMALINKNDYQSLAEKLGEFLRNHKLYDQQAERNLINSYEFRASALDKQRLAFYSAVASY